MFYDDGYGFFPRCELGIVLCGSDLVFCGRIAHGGFSGTGWRDVW